MKNYVQILHAHAYALDNIYEANIYEANLTELKGERDKSAIIFSDFNSSLSEVDGTTELKYQQEN